MNTNLSHDKREEEEVESTVLYVWGSNHRGQLGIGDKNQGKLIDKPLKYRFSQIVKQLACGKDHSLMLVEDKTRGFMVFAMGSNING